MIFKKNLMLKCRQSKPMFFFMQWGRLQEWKIFRFSKIISSSNRTEWRKMFISFWSSNAMVLTFCFHFVKSSSSERNPWSWHPSRGWADGQRWWRNTNILWHWQDCEENRFSETDSSLFSGPQCFWWVDFHWYIFIQWLVFPCSWIPHCIFKFSFFSEFFFFFVQVEHCFLSAAGSVKCWRRRCLKRQVKDLFDGNLPEPDPADIDEHLRSKLDRNRIVGMKRMKLVCVFLFVKWFLFRQAFKDNHCRNQFTNAISCMNLHDSFLLEERRIWFSFAKICFTSI